MHYLMNLKIILKLKGFPTVTLKIVIIAHLSWDINQFICELLESMITSAVQVIIPSHYSHYICVHVYMYPFFYMIIMPTVLSRVTCDVMGLVQSRLATSTA